MTITFAIKTFADNENLILFSAATIIEIYFLLILAKFDICAVTDG